MSDELTADKRIAEQINVGAKVLATSTDAGPLYTVGLLGPTPPIHDVMVGLHIDLFTHLGLAGDPEVVRYYHLLREAAVAAMQARESAAEWKQCSPLVLP